MQDFRRPDAFDHRNRVDAARRRQAEGDILEHLHQHAAKPEGDDLAEALIGDGADDDFLGLGQHLLHLDPGDVGARLKVLGVGDDGVVTLGHGLGVLETGQHPAGLGLVQDVRGDDLQDRGIADLRGELHRLIIRGCKPLLGHGDGVGVADLLGFGRAQRRAPVGLDLVQYRPDRFLIVILY